MACARTSAETGWQVHSSSPNAFAAAADGEVDDGNICDVGD